MTNVLLARVLWVALSPGPELPEVVVTADARGPGGIGFAGAVTVIDATTLDRAGARDDVAEALRGIAGLAVRDRRNLAQDLQISSRGYGARSSFGVRGLRLIVNGVPASAADGQGQLSHALVDHATRIEVERGPVAALYGNAAGAVVRIEADPAQWPHRYGGRFAATRDGWRTSATAAVHRETASALAVVSHLEHDGFRPHGTARRDQLDAIARGRFGELAWSAGANVLDQPEADDPLGLTRAAFDTDPDQTAAQAIAFDTRKSVRQRQLGASLARTDAASGFALAAHGTTREVVQFLAIPRAAQASATHAGGVIDLARDAFGVDARAWRRFAGESHAATLTGGLRAERLDEHRRGYENFSAATLGVRGALRRDEDNTTHARDLYIRIDLEASRGWSALAGWRTSALEFDSRDRYFGPGNPDDSGERRFDDRGPVAGLAWSRDPRLRWHLAWGEAFESPTANELAYRGDGAAGFNTALEPARSRQLETGLRVARDAWQLAVYAFRIVTDDEIVTAANTGGRSTFRNGGRTRRRGVELELDAALDDRTTLRAAGTWLDARFEDGFATSAGAVAADNRVPGIPSQQVYVELSRRYGDALRLGLVAEHTGRVAVDDLNRDFAEATTTFDVHATKRWGRVTGSLRLANVADRRYAGAVIVNEANGRWFEPAPGRRLLATLEVSF